MKISVCFCYSLLVFAATAMLAACGGPVSPGFSPPAGASGESSWTRPDGQRGALLYVSNANNGTVTVYAYPKGTLVQTLTGFKEPYGLCVDKKGDVWIVDDETALVTEYAHGGSQAIRTLDDAGEYPAGCSVDAVTGDLAVTNYQATSGGQGSVSIYVKAKGKPKTYVDSAISRGWFCSYDGTGDLFVDGYRSGTTGFQLAELPRGSGTFTNISVNQSITTPGGVQWDGKYVAVADENGPGNGTIYQFSISGSAGTEVSATTLDSSQNVHQFWIDPKRNRVVAPSASLSTVGFWKFPAGGYPSQTISGLSIPEAVAVSFARK